MPPSQMSKSDRWSGIASYWPRRLLHIPTMNSIERDETNSYSGQKEPKYGILTYTWGRWHTKWGPTLDIKGTTWKIPSVGEEHFSVADFKSIIDKMGEDTEWAWIDVACIDQEKDSIKMDEIGRQVGIFHNAHKVYVWLSHLKTTVLKSTLDDIWNYGPDLRFRSESTYTVPELVARLSSAFDTLFADPWFSSLWTLQESILRNDALILSREAEPIPLGYHDGEAYLRILINTCQNIYQDLVKIDAENPSVQDTAKRLVILIEQVGYFFLFTDNPNVQYGIARHRKTSYPLDRIYAIMQIYNLRVGQSVHPKRTYSFEELEDEFAEALNVSSPILGQMFVHLHKPKPGKAWRITQLSRVPDSLNSYRSPVFHCQISVTKSGHALFKGKACKFVDLVELWEKALELSKEIVDSGSSVLRYIADVDARVVSLFKPQHISSASKYEIILDDYIREGFPTLPLPSEQATREVDYAKREEASRYAEILLEKWGRERVWVSLLGEVEGMPIGGRLHAEREWQNVALLQRQVLSPSGDYYERLGLCQWQLSTPEAKELAAAIEWKESEMELY